MAGQQPKRHLTRPTRTALALLTATAALMVPVNQGVIGTGYPSSLDNQRHGLRRLRIVLPLLLVSLLAATGGVRPFTTRAATPAPSTGYLFGVLNDRHPERAAQDYAAGIRVVEMDLGWNVYEPQDGVFSDVTQQGSFAYTTKQALQAYKAAGLKVILGLNLQYTPDWVYAYPNSHYVDQFGGQASQANLTFNETLRQKTEAYIARVNQDLGLNNFYAIRAGAASGSELYFPNENAGGHSNGFWAFDANAQGGGNRPSSIPANPFPGWQPGQTTYNGQPFSTAQVGQWMDWYIGALVDGANWQIRTYRNLGFTGQVQVPIPGWGQRPNDYDCAVQHYLDGTCDATVLQQMGTGAVWNRAIDKLSDPGHNLAIDISSVDDSSSHLDNNPSPDLCQPSDNSVNINDSQINRWSATRWISYNARRDDYPMTGENPDQNSTGSSNPYGARMMRDSAAEMQTCGLGGLLWAFEDNLYNGSSDGTLSAYSDAIAQYPQEQGIVVAAPFSLASPSVVQGGSLTARATLQNTSGAPITLPQISLAGRQPGSTNTTGAHADFGSLYNVTLAPGQSVTIQQTRQFSASDPTGQWYGYLTYETADGVWHDDTHNVYFVVTAPAAIAASTATARPASTATARPVATVTPAMATATPTLAAPSFASGFETGDIQPTWTNTIDGGGYPAGGSADVPAFEAGTRDETAHGGAAALMYSGRATGGAHVYAYAKVFDLSGKNLVVGRATTLSYWIYPQSRATAPVAVNGTDSTCVALDLIFTDGTNLRDSGATDQAGNRLHPAYQCGRLALDTWNHVTAAIGATVAGKTIARIDVGYDQPGATGGYRGYIDDIALRN